jgi:hypothetical protein
MPVEGMYVEDESSTVGSLSLLVAIPFTVAHFMLYVSINAFFGIDWVLIVMVILKMGLLDVYVKHICRRDAPDNAVKALWELISGSDSMPLYYLSLTIDLQAMRQDLQYIAALNLLCATVFYVFHVWQLPRKWKTNINDLTM